MNTLAIDVKIAAHQLPTLNTATDSFFDRPGVQIEELPIGPGVPLGIEQVFNPEVGIGGAYGAWGESYDNDRLPELVEGCLGYALTDATRLRLAELGFVSRHHIPELSEAEHIDLEVAVGARILRSAAAANGWDPAEVEGVLIGMSVPAVNDFTERIPRTAGIPESAQKVTIHKFCDGSVAGLHLALNPELSSGDGPAAHLAERLYGKKVLVGGLEGLSRICRKARDAQALQLFGSAAGVIGVIPGQTMKFLVGGVHEVYDAEGLLRVQMRYPHSHQVTPGQSMIEVTEFGDHSLRFAGMINEPEPDAGPVVMAKMGLVKFFVRNGVVPVQRVYQAYQELMDRVGTPGKEIAIAIVHHANLKINQLKAKTLWNEGVCLPMPWLLGDFGNCSAASNMIAFLRALPGLNRSDHVLFDGFGAGTYYDVLAVELGGGEQYYLA